MNLERMIRDLMSAIRDQKKKPSAFDSVATVKRIEDNGKGKTAWVHFPGGVDETPVRMSVNAKVGDEVQVRVSGGRAWITGNNAAPPTDDAEAIKARNIAKGAQRTANKAGKSAEKAQKQAKSAQETAEKNAVDHVEKQYCLASANSIPSGGSFADIQVTAWSVDLPAFISGDYYWTREVVYYVDETVSAGAPILYSLGNVAAEASLLEHETNAHFFTDSNGAHVTQNDRQDYTGENSGYSNTLGPQGVLVRYNGKRMSAQTGSGFTIYKSDGESILTAFLGSGISFADDVPFLIGNVSGGSYLRWYRDTSVTPNKWKLQLVADEIMFGGVQVATLDDIDDSATYQILVDNYAVVKDSSGTYSVSTVTFNATKDTVAYAGRFVIKTSTDGSSWTTKYASSSNEASHTYTIPSGVLYIKGELYLAGGTTTLLDTQTVPIISDGTNGTDGTTFTPTVDTSGNISWTNDGGKTNPTTRNIKGPQGIDGADGYTIILTNESHTFAAGTSAAVAGNTTCQVIAFKGGAQVAATIGSISGAPTGMSTSISNNSTTSAYFTVTVTTSLTTTQGVLTVPITVDGKSFTKKFSWSLSRKGDDTSALYMTYIDPTYGVRVYSGAGQPNNYGQFNTNGLTVVKGGVSVASFSDKSVIGKIANSTARTEVTSSAMNFIIRDSSGTDVIVNSLTGSGMTLKNSSGQNQAVYENNGMTLYGYTSNTTRGEIAKIFCGQGKSDQGTNVTAPYYNFGIRKASTTIGNLSLAEGYDTTASNFAAHAEGQATTASGKYSHAEGTGTIASGSASHASGYNTQAVGMQSVALGYGTLAQCANEVAIGKWNDEDETHSPTTAGRYAFVIGNGSSVSERSNAFAVKWTGAVEYGDVANTFFVSSETITISNSSTGNIANTTTYTATKSGYYPIGVVGLFIETGGAYSRGCYIDNQASGSCNVHVRLYASTGTDKTSHVYVLWVREIEPF